MGLRREWLKIAEVSAHYFLAGHSWDGMPENHRQKFIDRLPPNFHQWDAVLNEEKISSDLKDI